MANDLKIGEIGQPFTLTPAERTELKLIQLTKLNPLVAGLGYVQMEANFYAGGEFELTDTQLFDLTLAGIQAQREEKEQREEQLDELRKKHEEYLRKLGS